MVNKILAALWSMAEFTYMVCKVFRSVDCEPIDQENASSRLFLCVFLDLTDIPKFSVPCTVFWFGCT